MNELEKAFREANKHIPPEHLEVYVGVYLSGVNMGVQFALNNVLLLNSVPPGFMPKPSLN